MTDTDTITYKADDVMPDVHLTRPMQDYVQEQIASGVYADFSEAMRAGIRLLMEKEGARQFYALKTDFERVAAAVEAGEFEIFDALAFEPDAFASQECP